MVGHDPAAATPDTDLAVLVVVGLTSLVVPFGGEDDKDDRGKDREDVAGSGNGDEVEAVAATLAVVEVDILASDQDNLESVDDLYSYPRSLGWYSKDA